MRNWLKRYLLDPLLALLRQGVSPRRLALCTAISTVLCTIIALTFRLNLPAMQLAQGAMAPLQLLLIIPYVRLGEWLLRAPRQPLSIKASLALLSEGAGHAIVVLWDAIVHASVAFALVAPVATFILYRLFIPVFERAAARIKRPAETPR